MMNVIRVLLGDQLDPHMKVEWEGASTAAGRFRC